jgi:transposase-like protein
MLRRHLDDKVRDSDLADEVGVQPSQIHAWVKQVLDQAKDTKIARFEEKLATKNEVIAELMEANVRLKNVPPQNRWMIEREDRPTPRSPRPGRAPPRRGAGGAQQQ